MGQVNPAIYEARETEPLPSQGRVRDGIPLVADHLDDTPGAEMLHGTFAAHREARRYASLQSPGRSAERRIQRLEHEGESTPAPMSPSPCRTTSMTATDKTGTGGMHEV
jgi:hypothetical protein